MTAKTEDKAIADDKKPITIAEINRQIKTLVKQAPDYLELDLSDEKSLKKAKTFKGRAVKLRRRTDDLRKTRNKEIATQFAKLQEKIAEVEAPLKTAVDKAEAAAKEAARIEKEKAEAETNAVKAELAEIASAAANCHTVEDCYEWINRLHNMTGERFGDFEMMADFAIQNAKTALTDKLFLLKQVNEQKQNAAELEAKNKALEESLKPATVESPVIASDVSGIVYDTSSVSAASDNTLVITSAPSLELAELTQYEIDLNALQSWKETLALPEIDSAELYDDVESLRLMVFQIDEKVGHILQAHRNG